MNAKELIRKYSIPVVDGKYREDGVWFHHLKNFPGALLDSRGYVIFITRNEYLDCPFLQHKQDLHAKPNISAIPGYTLFPDVEPKTPEDVEKSVQRSRIEISNQNRNQAIVKKIKELYDYKCQICEIQLEIRNTIYYIEVHHIRPIGLPHNGPDVQRNMICVCPNCHVLLDQKAIKIDINTFKIHKHQIDTKYIDYHNKMVI